jgi:hypothetical protein
MFRCSECGKNVPPKTPCKRKVITRIHHHPFRPKVQKKWTLDRNGKKKLEWADDPGGVGTQIVMEFPVCPTCGEGIV